MKNTSGNFMVALRVEHPKKKGQTTLKLMKDNQFPTRKSCRHWCKRQWYRLLHEGMVLLHPDGTREEFEYNGVL